MLMVGQQAIMDAYLCLLHLTAGIVVGECLRDSCLSGVQAGCSCAATCNVSTGAIYAPYSYRCHCLGLGRYFLLAHHTTCMVTPASCCGSACGCGCIVAVIAFSVPYDQFVTSWPLAL